MKAKKLLLAAMVAIFGMTSFVSCGEEKDEPSAPAAKTIAGTYKGDMNVSVMGDVSTYENVSYAVTATDESTVTVVLPSFGEAPMAMPSITVPGVKVSETDGVATLATTEVSGTTDAGKSYTCTLTGTVENNELNIKFNLQYGAMPMPLICSSKAVKL